MPATIAPRTIESGYLTFASNAAQLRRVRALVAYEGRFESMGGQRSTFTTDLLSRVSDASNGYLNSGVQVPLFSSNHQYDQSRKIGLVVGPFDVHEITEADLPHPDLGDDLLGKTGLFTWIDLIKEEAIADYDAKLIKPISMGVDFSGKYFPKDAVFEISCVGFSAMPGAQLFSNGGSMDVDFHALIEQAQEMGQELFGLRLEDKIAQEQMMPSLWRLFDAFTSLIREIMESDEEDKDALINQAVADLSVAVGARLRANPLASDPKGMDETLRLAGYSQPAGDEEQEELSEEDMEEIEELRGQVAQLKAEAKLSSLYSSVSAKARDLLDKRLITPAQFKEFCLEDASADGLISCFSKGSGDADGAIEGLNERLIELKAIEKYGKSQAPSAFGSPLANEPLEDADRAEEEVDEFLSSYSISSRLYSSPVEVGNAH